jgi:hypothetical protein
MIVLYGSSNSTIEEDTITFAEIAVQPSTLTIHKNPKMVSGFLLTN